MTDFPHRPQSTTLDADDYVAPGARQALVLLLVINLFNYIDRQVLAAVIPAIRKDLPAEIPESWQRLLGGRLENAMLGLLSMAFMVTYMVAAPAFGWMAKRFRRWWIVGFAVAAWSLASGASGLAMTFGILLITRCLVGIGEAAYGPVAPDVISDLYPVKRRGAVMAWFYMAIPVGAALGYILGGWMADSSLGWRSAFYLVVPPGLLLGVLCLFMREPASRGEQSSGPHAAGPNPANGSSSAHPKNSGRNVRLEWSDYATLFKTPSFILNTLGMTALTFALGGIGFWMPSYIHEFRQQGELGQVSLIFGAIVVVAGLTATLLGGMVGDWLRGRFSGSYFLVSGIAMLIGFPLSVAMLYAPFPLAWLLIFLACFCLFFNAGPTNTILANVTHPSIRSQAFALNILIIHALGDVISPVVIGAIADANDGDMNLAFMTVSATFLLAGIAWLWGARYLERDTHLAPHRISRDS